MFQKAEANLPPDLRNEIEEQLQSTRVNLVVYEYQRMMMLQKMDTVITQEELENYYKSNENSFMLTSNIVKALFIKLPVETPNISKIKSLARSNNQKDFQELESICYQFAEKFDDFNEEWITMDRLSLELNEDISNQENFLKKTTFYETGDSSSVYLIAINDYRLRGSLSPFEYVKEDIKRIIWNNRRIKFIQDLENGIYDEALKENSLTIS
jgi:HEPN domain-containing protein